MSITCAAYSVGSGADGRLCLAARHVAGTVRRVLGLVLLALGVGLVVPVAAKADLAISVSGAPSRIAVGENITYTITVTNNGPDTVGDQWWGIWLPLKTSFVSFSKPSSGWSCGQPTTSLNPGSSWQCGMLAPGLAKATSAVFTVTVHVTAAGTISLPTQIGPLGGTPNKASADTMAYVQPAIHEVIPNALLAGGSAGGVNFITIKGSGFTGATGITVNGVPLAAWNIVGDTTITGAVAAQAATGSATVTVTTPAGSISSNGVFSYVSHLDPPVITQVAPPSLPTTLAGLPIVVQGSGFTGIGSVLFGGIPVDFTVLTPNVMTVTTTPHAAGPVALTVSGQGGSKTLSNAFTYFAVPAPAK
jgi:uncharacterized repeat protein (TIGR01451 family)